ncbi:uncharacterized protein [Montipora foliosa]|uniref:uncharacterized protein n=1 Tax=Montipora foliosa TaxID=591990 RepID=UPI0035F20EEE
MTVSTLDLPLNPLLFDILLRFREHEVALTADIEKAFLNIEIDPEHRDFVRSLWVKDPNKEIDSALARELLKTLYVDDYASGNGDVDSAFKLSKEIKLCLKSGGFNMRKWSSYSESLLRSLEQDEAFSDDFEKSNRARVEDEDESFSKSVEKEQRTLCMAGKDWEESVDAELSHQWLATLSDLRQVGGVSFKRCYAEGLNGDKVKFYDFTVVNHRHWQEVQAVCRESSGQNSKEFTPEQWRYCSTADNPADIASRGIKSTELKESSLWLHGPDSLSKSSEQWPVQPTVVPVREELSELKSSKLAVTSLVTTFVEGKEEELSLDNLINPENYSSLKTLMLFFTEKLKKTRSREGTEDFTKLHRQAEMLRIRHIR